MGSVRTPVLLLVAMALAAALLTAGCGRLLAPSTETEPPWKDTPAPFETEAPMPTADASGVVPGCPVTLAEARAAVPDLARGPDVGEPFSGWLGGWCNWAWSPLAALSTLVRRSRSNGRRNLVAGSRPSEQEDAFGLATEPRSTGYPPEPGPHVHAIPAQVLAEGSDRAVFVEHHEVGSPRWTLPNGH